ALRSDGEAAVVFRQQSPPHEAVNGEAYIPQSMWSGDEFQNFFRDAVNIAFTTEHESRSQYQRLDGTGPGRRLGICSPCFDFRLQFLELISQLLQSAAVGGRPFFYFLER